MLAHLRTPVPAAHSEDRANQSSRPAYQPAGHLSVLAERPRQLHREVSTRAGESRPRRIAALVAAVVRGDEEPSLRARAIEFVQTPVTTGRRIVVTGTHGGAGATTVALGLTQVLHAHRPDGLVLIDAAGRPGGLVSRLSQAPRMSVAAADRHLSFNRPEAVLHPHARPILAVLAPADPSPAVALNVVSRLQRRVAFSIIDADAAHLDVMTPAADLMVLVAENTVRGVMCVNAAIRARVAACVSGTRVVVVISERVADSGVRSPQLMAEVVRHHDVPVIVLPDDRHLAGGGDFRSELLAPTTRTALLQMSAAIVQRSGPHE